MKIFIIDDQQTNLLLMTSLVKGAGFADVASFSDPLVALQACREGSPDLLLLDYMMPQLDGLEFYRIFCRLPHCQDVPVLMVTADHEKELRYQALQAGVSDFLTKPIDKIEFQARLRNTVLLRRQQQALKDRAVLLEDEVEKATAEIARREQETIIRLSYAAEYRDPETGAHILRMAHYAALMAEHLGLPRSLQQRLLRAAPMHDIGKVGIPDHILLKPGPLDEEEFAVIKNHPEIGHNILANSSSELLAMAAEIAYSHHEKYDGSGYPQRLAGDQIPLVGRICAVADVFDALTSARPYKPAWSVADAFAELERGRAKHFDPDCLEAFFRAPEKILRIKETYLDHKTDHVTTREF